MGLIINFFLIALMFFNSSYGVFFVHIIKKKTLYPFLWALLRHLKTSLIIKFRKKKKRIKDVIKSKALIYHVFLNDHQFEGWKQNNFCSIYLLLSPTWFNFKISYFVCSEISINSAWMKNKEKEHLQIILWLIFIFLKKQKFQINPIRIYSFI